MGRLRDRAQTLAGWTACLAAVLMWIGCATTEREAAQRLDITRQIEREAANLLAADAELGRWPILVDGFKGAMRLKGSVQTEGQKARAEKILWAVRGVRSVENLLDIQPQAGQGAPALPAAAPAHLR